MNVSGMKSVAMTVSTFITLFNWFETADRWASRMLGDPILEEHRFVRQPDEMIVDVAKSVRQLLVDHGNSRRASRPTTSRCGSTTWRSDETSFLKFRMLRASCRFGLLEDFVLELVEPLLELLDLGPVVVDHRVDDAVQQHAGAFGRGPRVARAHVADLADRCASTPGGR